MQKTPKFYEKIKANLRRGDMAIIARTHNVSRMTVSYVASGKYENIDILKALKEKVEENKKYLKLKAEVENDLERLLQ